MHLLFIKFKVFKLADLKGGGCINNKITLMKDEVQDKYANKSRYGNNRFH
jgi:hypothetical protein